MSWRDAAAASPLSTPPSEAAEPLRRVARSAWRNGQSLVSMRAVPEETAVAFTYNRTAYAVMMATPADLTDFALGFSLTEGVVERGEEIEELELVERAEGIELRMWLSPARAAVLADRRRHLAGPTGCGLCGLESLQQAVRPPRPVPAGRRFSPRLLLRALDSLAPAQTLHRETRAVHAAAFWQPGRGLLALREDVGRHNALDKLGGALALLGAAPAEGLLLLTSRVSVEMVQKAAALGAPVMVAVSAPTALALRVAEEAGITLVAVARGDGFEVFTHPERITEESDEGETRAHVA